MSCTAEFVVVLNFFGRRWRKPLSAKISQRISSFNTMCHFRLIFRCHRSFKETLWSLNQCQRCLQRLRLVKINLHTSYLGIPQLKVFKIQMEIRRISHRRSRELSYLTLLSFAKDGRKVFTDLQRKFKVVVLLAVPFEWKRSRFRLLVRELISKPRRRSK